MKVLCIGSVTKDIFFPTSEGVVTDTPDDVLSQKKIAFELGAKYQINERFESLGGCSVNVAAGLVRLGEGVSCYSVIGDDFVGEWITKELEKAGIGIENFTVLENSKSDLSAIIVDKKSSDRTIFSNQIANQKLLVEKDKIKDAEWIFIGDLSGEWEKNLDTIIGAAKSESMKVAFNPRQKTIHDNVGKIIEAISECEILFVNKDEAIEIVSTLPDGQRTIASGEITSEEHLIKELKNIGVKIVALTDGMRGAWGYDGNKLELLHVPALLHSHAVDSTGAGDAFASGFLAAHLKGKDLAASLQWGIINSSSVVREYGGQKGLLDEKGIELMISKVNVKKIN